MLLWKRRPEAHQRSLYAKANNAIAAPKLLDGRFTIHNGAIIILKCGSRQADAVLPAN